MSKDIRFYFSQNNLNIKNNTDNENIENNIHKQEKNINKEIKVEAFTDGSAINNGKIKVRSGIGVYFPRDDIENISINCNRFIEKNKKYGISKATNNVAELLAILLAIEQIIVTTKCENIILYSDSEYSINSITKWCKGWEKNNWKKKGNINIKNIEIIKKIYEYYKKYRIRFVHVNSHMPEPYPKFTPKWMIWDGNDKADNLAKLGGES